MLELIMNYWWVGLLLGILSSLLGLTVHKKMQPDPDKVQAQFVVLGLGCMTILIAAFYIFGILSSIISIIVGLAKLF